MQIGDELLEMPCYACSCRGVSAFDDQHALDSCPWHIVIRFAAADAAVAAVPQRQSDMPEWPEQLMLTSQAPAPAHGMHAMKLTLYDLVKRRQRRQRLVISL